MAPILHFLLHLRLHYQLGILSGCYLTGALFVIQLDVTTFWLQFVNVHVLLFAGATAFNSYWDKDEGPIGGLRNPPPMQRWMRDSSMLMQFAGLVWAYSVSLSFAIVYVCSMVLFWLYSTPLVRWKSHPILSMIAIAGSTGVGGFLMGYLAGGGQLQLSLLLPIVGVSFILLSMYPVSQLFQVEEDTKRGDRTFASVFGLKGVQNFFLFSYAFGIFLLALGLSTVDHIMAGFFLIVAGLSGFLIWFYFSQLQCKPSEYPLVMRIKWLASSLFVFFILVCYIQIHVIDAGRIFERGNHRLALGLEWIIHSNTFTILFH